MTKATKGTKTKRIGSRTFVFRRKKFANGETWDVLDVPTTVKANKINGKRKSIKTKLAALMLMPIMALMLAACGGIDPLATPTAPPPPTPTVTPLPSPTETPDIAPEPQTLAQIGAPTEATVTPTIAPVVIAATAQPVMQAPLPVPVFPSNVEPCYVGPYDPTSDGQPCTGVTP